MRLTLKHALLAFAAFAFMSVNHTYAQTSTKTIVLEVTGMSCQMSCANGIDAKLKDVNGIETSETSYSESTCTVTYNPDEISSKKIIKLIKGKGYGATVKKEGTKGCNKNGDKKCCKSKS